MFGEPRFRISQVAKMIGLSPDATRDLFHNEAGVIRIDRPETRFKRGYLTIVVPESVPKRVYERLSSKPRWATSKRQQ